MERSIVVSGGGTGMGRAVARSFARDGDRVLIVGRRAEVLAETAAALNAEAGPEAVRWQQADLSVPAEVERLEDAIDVVDVLVNNAGGVDRADTSTLEDVMDAWLRDLASNLLTAALLTTAVEPHLRRPGGRIVNISSIAASEAAASPTRPRSPR
jgi:3-oxoacyl-[acyl-carrier protein] reductase